MDSTPTHQAPCGPMTRARARAMETEVNSFLVDMHMDTSGTWLLPHQHTLCLIRYEVGPFQAAEEHHQVQGEATQVTKDEERAEQQPDRKSQATPCARAPETQCPQTTQGATTVAPRTHGRVPCARAQLTPCARALQGGRF